MDVFLSQKPWYIVELQMLKELYRHTCQRLNERWRGKAEAQKPSYQVHSFYKGCLHIPAISIPEQPLPEHITEPSELLLSIQWKPHATNSIPYCYRAELRWRHLLDKTVNPEDFYSRIDSIPIYLFDAERDVWIPVGNHPLCIKDKLNKIIIDNEKTGVTIINGKAYITSGPFSHDGGEFVLIARPWEGISAQDYRALEKLIFLRFDIIVDESDNARGQTNIIQQSAGKD
jgi:hypothetical protein